MDISKFVGCVSYRNSEMVPSPSCPPCLPPDGSTLPDEYQILDKTQTAAARRCYGKQKLMAKRNRSSARNDGTTRPGQDLNLDTKEQIASSRRCYGRQVMRQKMTAQRNRLKTINGAGKQRMRAPAGRPSKDLNPEGVVDSICPSENLPPFTVSVEDYTTAPHRSSQGLNPTGVVDGVCPSNNGAYSVACPEDFVDPVPEKSPGNALGERQSWIAAGEECYNLYQAMSAEVTMNADLLSGCGIDGRIHSKLDFQADSESPANLDIHASLHDLRKWLEEDSRTSASQVQLQAPGQDDSPMIIQSYPAAPQFQYEVPLDCTLNDRQGAEGPVGLQWDYPIHSNVVHSSQVLPGAAFVESEFVQPLPEIPIPVGPLVANYTITNPPICSAPAPVPMLTSGCKENSVPSVSIPVQVYPQHSICSNPASLQSFLTQLKDTTEIPTVETGTSAGRNFEILSFHSEQLSTSFSQKTPHAETLPFITPSLPGGYQEPLKTIMQRDRDDPLVKERNHICKSMLGSKRNGKIDGLDKSLDDILAIHQVIQRCREERKPFHIYRKCASEEDTTAANCCWLDRFGSINPNDNETMRSFRQMCTKAVNSAARKCAPCRICRFPDWVDEEFKKFLKLHPKGIRNCSKDIKEVKEFAESLGIEYSQVILKMKHGRFDIAKDKREQDRQAKDEAPA